MSGVLRTSSFISRTPSPAPSSSSMPADTPPRSPSPPPSPSSTAPGTPPLDGISVASKRKLRFSSVQDFRFPEAAVSLDPDDQAPGTSSRQSNDIAHSPIEDSVSSLDFDSNAEDDNISSGLSVEESEYSDTDKPANTSDSFRQTNDYHPTFLDQPPMSLYTVLCAGLPEVPEIDPPGSLKTTRGASTYDYELPEDQQLDTVVFQKHLIDQVEHLSKATLEKIEVDPASSIGLLFLTHVLPECTTVPLPKSMRSEHDSEDWTFSSLVRPAITTYKAAVSKPFVLLNPGDKTYDLTSGNHSKNTIPDALLTHRGSTQATYEIKSHNALPADTFDTFSELYDSKNPSAIRFVWPKDIYKGKKRKMSQKAKDAAKAAAAEATNKAPVEETKAADFLVQVWSQMIDRKVQVASISSYETTLFFFKEENSRTLYVSRPYSREDRPILANFSFVALAFGHIPLDEIKLHPVDKSNWEESKVFGPRAGFDKSSFPEGLLERAAARAASADS